MEMRYQYGLPDLRQLMAERTHFPAFSQAPDQFPGHQNLTTGQHYEMMMMMMSGPQVGEVLHRGVPVVDFRSDSTNSTTTTSAVCGFEMEGCVGGDGGNSRWPRQETLTLLEIRSLLDPKFKETNQKGPLWDEVSRIMKEEHGYQRSGKKCREKFENLYKYYKKTKEGKAGRQDGKHYRFFRQLEALYGESSNPVLVSETHVFGNNPPFHTTANTINYPMNQEGLQAQKLPESRSISNSSDFGPSSSSEDDYNNFKAIASEENDSIEKKKKKMKANQCLKRGRKSWKAKIRDIINLQMRKFMERQEAWLEKILKTLDNKEHERISREEEWRKQEEERIEREHKIWANERTWFEARDAALMETLKKFTGREVKASSPDQELMATELHEKIQNQKENESETLESSSDRWLEAEISNLINLRNSLETSFQQDECSKGVLWEEISMKMACMGYDRCARRCEEKWENINKYSKTTKECNKRRKEDSRTGSYFQNLESIYNQGQAFCGNDINDQGHETNRLKSNDGPSNLNSNAVTAVGDSCFRFMMTEGENLWENYCVKLNKGENQ